MEHQLTAPPISTLPPPPMAVWRGLLIGHRWHRGTWRLVRTVVSDGQSTWTSWWHDPVSGALVNPDAVLGFRGLIGPASALPSEP